MVRCRGLTALPYAACLGLCAALLRVRRLRGLQAACFGGACGRLLGPAAAACARVGLAGRRRRRRLHSGRARAWAVSCIAPASLFGRRPPLPCPCARARLPRRLRRRPSSPCVLAASPAPAAARKHPLASRLQPPQPPHTQQLPRIAPGKRHRVMPSARTIRTIAQPALVYG